MMDVTPVKGAKAGGEKPRTPVIMKDNLSSISTVKILYGLAEGEVAGLVDGGKSIRLDGTPLVDDAGNPNFEGVTWDFRHGTNDQEYIQGFPDVSNETPIGVEIKSSQPWVKAFTDTQLDAVRVRFKWDRLTRTNTETGDVDGVKIDYAIDLQIDGGAYSQVLSARIWAKTSAGYERTHRIDLPKAKTGWQIRVRRITPNSDSDLIQDKMMIEAVAEVIDVKLAYPNTALLGVEYNAEIFSNIAKIEVDVMGKVIRVPDNYDPVARTYTGIWTGNFKDAYSNNPAWIFYDLCTQWRGGLGERLDATMIDRWSLYALGQYCDQPVSDGQGGLEPRFTCNVYLQKQEEAYTVLQNIAGIFRAMSFWTGEKIFVDADVPQDSIYTYSAANIVGGVAGIQYSGTRNRDRHTLAKVAWDNPNNDYQTEYEYIRDEKAMSKFGVKVLDLSAFGCTSQAQAQRAGLWALKTEQLETRQVTFSVGLDGAIPRVGNIISLSDEAFAGRANGGRVSTVNSTQRIIELDREVTASVGDVLIINGGSGKSERRNISNVVGNRITVTAGFTSAEPEHVWAIETADLKLMRFRVMSITENDDATYAITGIQHEPQKYDAIDFGTDVKPTDITIVNPDSVDAPDTVSIESRHRVAQGQTVTTLVIAWSQVEGAVSYDVEWRKDDGTWIKVPRTGNVSVEIEGVYSGNYMARVRAISAFDVQSRPTTSILTDVKGKIGLPPTVVGLTATGVLFGMDLKWGFQAGSGDAAFTEIQVGSAPNVNVATLTQVSYPTNTHTVTGLQGNLKQSYRARLVDKLGFKSDWTAWVTGTTDASADKVMDLIQGQINESSLNQALTSKIEKIETNSSSIGGINTELDKAKADIAAADKVIAANKTEAANAVAAANKAISDNKLIASNAVAAANAEIAASKVIIDSNKAEISAAKTELNTAKTQLATAISDIGTANTKIADHKILIDANKAKLVLTDAEVAAAKTKVTALETDYNGNKTSVSNALTVLTNKDKSLASDISTLTASYGASEAKLVQDLKVLTDKDVALTNSVTTLSSSYEANKTKVATDITTLVNKDTALNNLLTTLDSDYKTNKASVSNSLTTLTNKDTALTSDISKLNTKTDNTNAEIVTVKNLVSDNTSSIATTKTELTAAYKQAIDDIEIGGRNYFQYDYLSDPNNWTGGNYKNPKEPIQLEPNTVYTLDIKNHIPPAEGESVDIALQLRSGDDMSMVALAWIWHPSISPIPQNGIRLTRAFNSGEDGKVWFSFYNGARTLWMTERMVEAQIFKGTVLQDWTPAPEDIEADYNAKISTEATARSTADTALTNLITTLDTDYKGNKTTVSNSLTALSDKDTALGNSITDLTAIVGTNTSSISAEATARADADKAITSSVTTLKSDYDANKASVTNSLSTLTSKDTALTNSIAALTTRVGTAEGTITSNNTALVNKDKALTDSLNALTTDYNSNKTTVSNSLTALSTADTALGTRITTLDTDYKGNKTAIRSELTAVSNKTNSTATSLGTLTTTVGGNTTKISQESTARSTADTALGNRITATDAIAKNAQSRVGTAETAISNATSAIAQQKTEVEAKFNNLANKNLVENGTFAVGQSLSPWSISTSTRVVGEASHDGTLNAIRLGVSVSNSYMLASKLFKELGYHTLSFWIKGNKAGSLNVQMQDQVHLKVTPVTTTWVKHTFSANITSLTTLYSVIFGGWSSWTDLSLQVSLSNIELTKDSASVNDVAASVTAEATARSNADTALGNRITTLDTDYKGNKTTVSNSLTALSNADTALGSRITTLDTDYKGNKTAIRTELTAVSNKTNSTATSLGTLTTTVGSNTTKISQESTARSTADTALGSRITATDAIAKNAQSRVGTAETAISTANSAIATLRTDLTASYSVADTRSTNQTPAWYQTNHPRQVVREFKTASAVGVSGGGYAYLETTVKYGDASGGRVSQEATMDSGSVFIRTGTGTAWSAWVEQEDVAGSAAKVEAARKALDTKINATDARVTAEKTVAANATSAVAKTVGTLTTTVNGHTSSIQTQQTSINGLNAQYTVKLDVGGRVSGFGLASSATQSDFAINADKFYIAPPTGSSKGTSPFMVLTAAKTINGVSVPAGTYMQSAYIHNGSIDTAKIKDLSVNTAKIALLAVKTAQIDNLAVSTAKIANLAVKSAQIDNLAVTTGKIANLAVNTLQINDYAITIPRVMYRSGIVRAPDGNWSTVHTATAGGNGGHVQVVISIDAWETPSGTAKSEFFRLLVNGSEYRIWRVYYTEVAGTVYRTRRHFISVQVVVENLAESELKLQIAGATGSTTQGVGLYINEVMK